MNTVLPTDPLSAPHLLVNRLSPSREPLNLQNQSMSTRKRKASEEPPDSDRMSTSPSASPAMAGRRLPSSSTYRSIKKSKRGTISGRPLALPRLLETMSADDMRQLLHNICDQRPELQQEIETKAPRPSVESTLAVLNKYEAAFHQAFPHDERKKANCFSPDQPHLPTSDYAYNRVRQHLQQLIEVLREYTPPFLPPHETQLAMSLDYLHAVTDMIHRLPDWDTFQHHRHKHEAYDEIAEAWTLVIKKAANRAGGFPLHFGGWDRKLMEHNQKSGGRLAAPVNALSAALGFMPGSASGPGAVPSTPGVSDERLNIRQQLFSGSYGHQLGVGPGGW